MKRTLWVVFVILAVLVGLCSAVAAAERELVLFSGKLDTIEGASWGGGEAELSEDQQYLDRQTLQVKTKGFHEGGRLDLKNPRSMEDFLTNPEKASLVLVVKTHREKRERQRPGPGQGPPGEFPEGRPPEMMPPGEFPEGGPPEMMPPGAPGQGEQGQRRRPGGAAPGEMEPPPGEMGPGMEPGMEPGMGPGGVPEQMPPGGPGPGMEPAPPGMEPGMSGEGAMGRQQAPAPMITSLRALLVTDKGQIDSGEIDIRQAEDALENWHTLVVPLSEFAGPGKTPEAILENVALFGNVEEKFSVATVKLVVEDQPLVADAGENRRVQAGTPAKFEAEPQPGNVNARYVWDFDDWDGLQEDAIGREVTWPFPEPGHYTVTLTVSDRSGDRVQRVDRVHVLVEE